MSDKKNFVNTILHLSMDMMYVITMLINIRNSGIESDTYKDADTEGVLCKKRCILISHKESGYDVNAIYDFLINDIKKFEFDFEANRLEPFSLEQILDFDFYPDKENCPRIASGGYRTIKSAPNRGNISPELIERAVKVVLCSPDKVMILKIE